MDRQELTDSIERYKRAWRSPGTDGLAALFTEMTSGVVAVEGDTGVARVTVRYGPPSDKDRHRAHRRRNEYREQPAAGA